MDRAYLRPPFPLYQVVGAVLALPLCAAALWVWQARRPDLQRLYLHEYLAAGLPSPPDIGSLLGGRRAAKTRAAVLICYREGRAEVPALGPLDWSRQPHPVVVRMTTAQWAAWLRRNIYGGKQAIDLLLWPLLCGVGLAAVLWIGAWYLDQERHLKFRRQRVHLSGPRIVNRREFLRGVSQTGLGLWLERRVLWGRLPLRDEVVRVERTKEPQHFLFVGDPGSGKTSAMMSLLDDCEARGYRAVCYDPHLQYLRRYWKADRGDQILGLDDRAAAWNPSDEIDWSSESTAMADWAALMESLYPGEPSLTNGNSFYFTSVSRDIGQHCGVNYRPNAAQLAELYSNADPMLDHVVKGTPLEETLHKNTSGTRSSIMGTLTTNIVPMLRQIRTPDADHPGWSAREYTRRGKGWLFLTSTQANRITSGPVQRLWIDLIARNILSQGENSGVPPTALVLDEMYALGMLMSVKMLIAEARKSGLMIAMGFQAKAQIKEWYGEYHEVLISAPWHKWLGRVGDVEGQKLAAGLLGRRRTERVREHRGGRGERSWTTEEVEDYVVEPSELGSLKNRHAYFRVEDMVLPVQVAIPPRREERCPGWIPRKGAPPKLVPMPNLAELRAKEAAKREAAAAAKQAAHLYRPPPKATEPEATVGLAIVEAPRQRKPKRGPGGKQEG